MSLISDVGGQVRFTRRVDPLTVLATRKIIEVAYLRVIAFEQETTHVIL